MDGACTKPLWDFFSLNFQANSSDRFKSEWKALQAKLRQLGFRNRIVSNSDANLSDRYNYKIKNWVPIKGRCRNPIKIANFWLKMSKFVIILIKIWLKFWNLSYFLCQHLNYQKRIVTISSHHNIYVSFSFLIPVCWCDHIVQKFNLIVSCFSKFFHDKCFLLQALQQKQLSKALFRIVCF